MTISYFVFYQGKSEDQERFLEHYKNVHVPILYRFPGIKRVSMHSPTEGIDPENTQTGGFALLAQLVFEDQKSLNEALQSEERILARQDMLENFPHFTGNIMHQAMQTDRINNE